MQLQFYLMICVIHLEKECLRPGPGSPILDSWLGSQGRHTAGRTCLISWSQKDPEPRPEDGCLWPCDSDSFVLQLWAGKAYEDVT